MLISVQVAFSLTKPVLLASYNTYLHVLDASKSESDLHEVFLPMKKNNNGMLFVMGWFQW